MGNPVVNSKGELQIPEGYFWCSDCEALTPHEKGTFSHECVICGNSLAYSRCPNCGAPEPEEDGDFEQEVTLHHPGCHCQHDYDDGGDSDEIRYVALSYMSWAEHLCYSFERQWMSPFPNRSSYSLPKDREWYNGYVRLHNQYQAAYKVRCGCPRVTIYRVTGIFNYECHSVMSMDCMNAQEWSYDVRCKVCGEVYGVADGNC